MKDQDAVNLLSDLPGKSIRTIRRIMYVVQGTVTTEAGPIEITFADDMALLLDAAGDGEALEVRLSAWADPFAEPLSPENKIFVEHSGKWTAFDVSGQLPYSRLIAQQVREVTFAGTSNSKIRGVTIKAARSAIRVDIEADEVFAEVM
jgi:hypothetical protein